ncbi:hypothetical protein MRX96_005027 [Rhipicephalus microplus]
MLVLENALPTALARAGFFPLALDGTRARARWWRHRAPSWKTNQDGGAHGRTRLTSAVRESTGEKLLLLPLLPINASCRVTLTK